MGEPKRFAAFISYSHKDEILARWLHRALESYQPPKGLLTPGSGRTRPAPVFRDADELAAASDLTAELKAALDRSDSLVVLCSPNSVASRWVAQEIDYFRETGKGHRIFPVIVDGEPNAPDPARECLPLPLKSGGPDGHEALAADARERSNRRSALLKVVAGLLGVSLGDLIDRDAQRRRRRLIQIGAAAAVVATVIGVLGTAWIGEARRSALETRNRLQGEMREAFANEDVARGLTALARLWPDLPADKQAAYRPVLAAWLAQLPDVGAQIAALENGEVFAADRRVFQKSGEQVLALPFDASHLVVPAAGGFYAMAPTGRLSWLASGAAAAVDVTPPDAADWVGYRWRAGAALSSGMLVLAGVVQSASAGGASPTLLVLEPARKVWRLLILDDLSADMIELSKDCATMTASGKWTEDERALLVSLGPRHAVSLRDATVRPGAAAGAGTPIDFAEAASALRTIAAACGGNAQSADGDGRKTIALPAPAEPGAGWRLDETASLEPDAKAIVAFAAIGADIQRGAFEMPKDGAEDRTADERRTEIAGAFSTFDFAAPATANVGAVGVFWASSGAQYGKRYICVAAPPAAPQAPVRCSDIRYHGNYGAVRIFDKWVYIQDMAFAGRPMFHLISRTDASSVAIDAPETQGERGGAVGAAAVSPSGRMFALATGDRFWIFTLENGRARLSARIDAAGLSGAGSDGDGAGEAVTLAFIDDTRLVAARVDGLVFATDLAAGDEIWRTRIRPTAAVEDAPAHTIASAGGRIAITGKDFATLLDAATGLPLAPTATFWRDASFSSGGEAQEPAARDPSCPGGLHREGCLTQSELRSMAERAEAMNRPILVASQDGFRVLASNGVLVVGAIASGSGGDIRDAAVSAACKTGWRVHDGRIERANPLASLKPGDWMPIGRLGACDG